MHWYSNLTPYPGQRTAPGWHDSLLRRSRDSVCGLGQWGPHRILWYVARMRSCIIIIIHCLTLVIIKWYDSDPPLLGTLTPDLSHHKMICCLTWLVMLIHARTGYQESGCSTPVKVASYGLIGYPMVASPCFQHLISNCNPKPPLLIPKQTPNSILFTRPGVTSTRTVCMGCPLSTMDSLPSILP